MVTFALGFFVGLTVTWIGLLMLGRHVNRKRAREFDREYSNLVRVLGE
jgi:hypothetical protein